MQSRQQKDKGNVEFDITQNKSKIKLLKVKGI